MTAPHPVDHQRPYELVIQHSLSWLLFTCVIGCWLATLLLAPSFGVMLEPLGYGRWATVHLDASLYGWASVPLIGLLFLLFLPRGTPGRLVPAAVPVWSGMILFAMVGWLAGHTSGKLFMEWEGAERWDVLAGMAFLALALWVDGAGRIRADYLAGARMIAAAKVVVLAGLSLIPVVMYAASDPALYPPVNPDSGGATGGSLLGSTLGLIVIYWAAPFILGIPSNVPWRQHAPTLFLLVGHLVAFGLLDHGDHSHREPVQLAAMFSLFLWPPVLLAHFRRFEWPTGTKRWLYAFAAWGLLLVVDGVFTFLPGILEKWKFTNALVGHVHIAMAGMLTSFNMLVLIVLARRAGIGHGLDDAVWFRWWHGGTTVHAAALIAAGSVEAAHPSWLFSGHPAMMTCYGLRWAGGLAMTVAAVGWWWSAHRDGKDAT